MNEVLEISLEFQKLEEKSFSLCEVLKVFSEKYQTFERNIYYDAETPDTWQLVLTQLFDLDKACYAVSFLTMLSKRVSYQCHCSARLICVYFSQ